MTAAFGSESTADEVLAGRDLTGTRALVTGASAGIGVETVRALAARGARVIAAVRDRTKADRNLSAAGVPPEQVEVREVDLASLASVRAFTDGVLADHDRLDLLIANAGIMACPEGRTADGFETQFGTNHLGHFVLTNRLAPLLGSGSRVVVLSSSGHRFSDVDLDDPGFERTPYEPWPAYGRSKTANALFAVALDGRLRARGARAAAVHPGAIVTELGRHMTADTLATLTEAWKQREGTARTDSGEVMVPFKSVAAGAATSVWAGVTADADAVGGRYCEDCSVSDVIEDRFKARGVLAYAVDADHADDLWARSEELVGERFEL